MQKSTPLPQFLADIALDPMQYAAYVRHPVAAMQTAGLGATAQAALRSGNGTTLSAYLAAEAADTSSLSSGPTLMMLLLPMLRAPGELEPFQPLR